MAGKSYGIKELKTIVEYLTENKLYGEIKGRKMWMDFANTQLTTRSWQSLKETFLKRILPDIHNPYYKLTNEQITSFRSGYDVSDRNKNKLEIHTISDDSNDHNENDTPQSHNDYGIKEEILAGENIKCSKIPTQNRSSADTVIVDTCYETAEEIQKDLESPGGEKSTKSLRDCITYSEPLTPMLQEVLDDFQSEPENEPEVSDRENIPEIGQTVQTKEPDSDNVNQDSSKTVKENIKSVCITNGTSKEDSDSLEKKTDPGIKADELKDKQTKNIQEPALKENDPEVVCCEDESPVAEKQIENETDKAAKNQSAPSADLPVNNDTENTDIVIVHDSNSEIIQHSDCVNNSNSTTDNSLPNNPEALKKRVSNDNEDKKLESPEKKTDNQIKRKRSNSENTTKTVNNKKTKLNKKKSRATSETESKKTIEKSSQQQPINIKPNKVTQVESIPEETDMPTQNKIDKSPPGTFRNPSTSIAQEKEKIPLTLDTEQSRNSNESSEIKNPCLQNVSLFEEQFNKTKYSTSESESEANKNKIKVIKDKTDNNKANKIAEKEDTVMLKSHTDDSDVEELPSSPKKKRRPEVATSKRDRDRALANMFGCSSGTSPTSMRQRQLSRVKRTIVQNLLPLHNKHDTDSSDWTSESEAYVSPPRSRKNRKSKKYLKPQSGRILSLEQEGGLFVMHGKKIYPLVKDGKLVKNYLTYLPETDSEDERSYWKSKYEVEKKKTEELKKLLEKAKEPSSRRSTFTPSRSSEIRTPTCNHNKPEAPTDTGKEVCVPENNVKKPEPTAISSESIKIKFTTKNDQEIHLEGNWPQIHNVLEHVVHIFHKEPQPISERPPKPVVEPPSSSGISTPVVISAVQEPVDYPDVHEKVNKIESEIFKEIEERDKEEVNDPKEQENNVTKRKAGKPRTRSQSSLSQSPAKKQKTSDQSDSKAPEIPSTDEKIANDVVNGVTADTSKKQLRTSRRILNESLTSSGTKNLQTRRSKLNTSKTEATNEDDEIRYMLPPKTTRQTVKSTADKNSKDKPNKRNTRAFSSPDFACTNSLESTQGYQDTDPSPPKLELRKKKMKNACDMKSKTINHLRRISNKNSQQHLCHDGVDSNNSPRDTPVKTSNQDNSTLSSSVYKSESYQLLNIGVKNSFTPLDPIDETRSVGNEVEYITHLESTAKNEVFAVEVNTISHDTGQAGSDFGSSSNISLPLSPELSVVESLSVSRELLNTVKDVPMINETQCNEAIVPPTLSQYVISDMDVSVPLMQQKCELEGSNILLTNDVDKQNHFVTESLLSKIGTINITDQSSVTDTLDVKLKELLLESAKKMAQEHKMDIDEANFEVQKKTRSKKRCSTPRKRKYSTKSKNAPKIETLVEDEHIESFAKGGRQGRQSCPPIIQTLIPDDNEEINISDLTINENVKSRGRKKKDIIKVKILKPKTKKTQNDSTTIVQNNSTKQSMCSDSGINETESGVFLRGDESVELIHNHSETCLHANDCVADSIEFVENSMKSVLSLSDSTQSQDELINAENIIPEFFCDDAQHTKRFYNPKPDDLDSCETVYHTPKSNESSLITEDLSDDFTHPLTKLDKWYLLSEEDTTNTNMGNVLDSQANVASFGANLKQIFPLTCAVPDLSTITELSRESDSSRKPTLNAASGDGSGSQSIFD